MPPRRTLAVFFLLAFALAAPASAKDAVFVGIEHKVPAVSAHDRSAIQLYVWEKRAAATDPALFAKSGKVVVLAHGATISGRPDFDLQFPPDSNGVTYSLMDELAAHGYDVFSVDYQNYGGSDRVPCGLCVTSEVAANDIGAAVDYIRKLRGVDQVNLLGWSWGATTAGLYAQHHPDKVRRLVQYALFLEGSKPGATFDGGQFHPVDMEKCCRADFAPGAADPGVFDAYARQALEWEKQAPNGVYKDVTTRMPLLDPKQIRVPTLMIYGALDTVCRSDQTELPGYFRDLATPDKALVIVPKGGHALLLEQMRGRLHSEVQQWFAAGEGAAIAAHGANSPDAERTRTEITNLLNTFLTPAVNASAAGHERFWADDLVYTSSTGKVMSKTDIMKSFADAPAAASGKQSEPGPVFTAEDILVRPFGDMAALTFRLVERDPDGKITQFRNSGTFLRRHDQWQAITWQATRVIKPDS